MKRVFFVFAIVLFALLAINTYADQYDDVTNELEGLKKTFNDLNKSNNTNQATLDDLNKQLQSIKGKILFFENGGRVFLRITPIEQIIKPAGKTSCAP